MKLDADTVAAIASGVGGSITILRISGPESVTILRKVWRGNMDITDYPARSLQLGDILDANGVAADRGMAVYMPGPNSYTGEDVVELQIHGGPMIARIVMGSVLRAGARHADPGEFTKRAFINGKLDLTQAEAIADLISAHSEMAVHTANRQLQGRLGQQIREMLAALTDALAEIEVRMDFVDEELDWQTPEQLITKLKHAENVIQKLLAYSNEGQVLRHGIRLVIVGAPNAGKSSLLNLLLGQDRAIVTHIPGTTRDTVEELAQIRSIPVRLTDTAGIRETEDLVEQQGVERSLAAMEGAQIVLWMLDATRPFEEQLIDQQLLEGKQVITAINKIDLNPEADFSDQIGSGTHRICATNGNGLAPLLDAVEVAVWGEQDHPEPEVAVSARHSDLLNSALRQLEDAERIAGDGDFELIAIHLRTAIDALGKITGQTIQADILDYIFSNFCIGK